MSVGAAVFGSTAIGAGSVAGQIIEDETDVSILEYNELDRETISTDRSLVRNHPAVSQFEAHFSAYELEFRSASGFSVVTDDPAVNEATPRIVLLGYADERFDPDPTGPVEIPGNSGVIIAQLETHSDGSRVVSAAPFIAEQLSTASTRLDLTFQIKTLEQRGRDTNGVISSDEAATMDLNERVQDQVTVGTDSVSPALDSDAGTESVSDLIGYLCAGTCTPMVLYICDNASGSVSRRTCVSACFRFVTNPWLLGACGGACLILIDFINDQGCAAGAGTICAAFCSQAS